MIVSITRNTATLALRIKETRNGGQLTDWRPLRLIVSPVRPRLDPCYMGSPIILTGCWPAGQRTGVDIANPAMHYYDFPAIVLNAIELDGAGRVVFGIDDRVRSLPPGRYLGTVEEAPGFMDASALPFNLTHFLGKGPQPGRPPVPADYDTPGCDIEFPQPPMPEPHIECCVLAEFDIDLSHDCREHIIDQAAVEYATTYCGE